VRTQLKFPGSGADPFGMERRRSGYLRNVRTGDDDGLWSELGQTLTLFGMGLAVVLIGLLMGLGL
jgi:hypothetical protein